MYVLLCEFGYNCDHLIALNCCLVMRLLYVLLMHVVCEMIFVICTAFQQLVTQCMTYMTLYELHILYRVHGIDDVVFGSSCVCV